MDWGNIYTGPKQLALPPEKAMLPVARLRI
jgi:hypothetical protein